MTTYLDRDLQTPHCPGCGHPHVLRGLDDALQSLAIAPERVALVTDIGCVGLADALFPGLHTVHTLHGRAAAVAAGISMGTPANEASPLKTIVLVGDGGASIGLLHLVHAAQTNADIMVLVHNNLIYGMTGGQHSLLTPDGLKTTTTPSGNPHPALDLGAVLMGAGASFFARTSTARPDMPEVIAAGIAHPGFACVEVLELCPTFATRIGGLKGKDIATLPEDRGLAMGILRQDVSRPAFARPVRSEAPAEEEPGIAPVPTWGNLDQPRRILLAGRAGERVQSAALLAARAAAASGLHATVRSDNPVTQGRGFSLADLTVSPEPIAFPGLRAPDFVVATAPEGRATLEQRGALTAGEGAGRILIDLEVEIPDGLPAEHVDLRKRFGGKQAALGTLIEIVHTADWWADAAWWRVVDDLGEARAKDATKLLEKVGVARA